MTKFETSGPTEPGKLGMGLFTTASDKGRVMDSFKVVLAGPDMLTIKLGLTDLTPNPDLTYQIYSAHVEIRKNMTPQPGRTYWTSSAASMF
jgi:hypothetical protein